MKIIIKNTCVIELSSISLFYQITIKTTMQEKEDKRKYNGAKKGSKKTKLKYGEPLKKCTMEFPTSKVQEIKTEIRKTILIKYIK